MRSMTLKCSPSSEDSKSGDITLKVLATPSRSGQTTKTLYTFKSPRKSIDVKPGQSMGKSDALSR
jgi:hypothetical protein